MRALNHPHPGLTLREEVFSPQGMTVSAAADKLGVSSNALSRVLNGKAGVSIALAMKLEANGFSTARFWTALQHEYDLAKAKHRETEQ